MLADWGSPLSPGNRLQRGKKCSSSMNIPVGLKPILPKFHVCAASFLVLNPLWFAVFSQQLVTRAPCSLVQSCLLYAMLTGCSQEYIMLLVMQTIIIMIQPVQMVNLEWGQCQCTMCLHSIPHVSCICYSVPVPYHLSRFHTCQSAQSSISQSSIIFHLLKILQFQIKL